ncbi:MAG: tRNA (adenine(22)-N(1))-methyltransferase TrmK [Kangiellaceae bacterium]|nr:tRNA (adenine(22)-N(1))-methyltransferase TrmK [Kangiellaceae bacterium]
MKLGKRLSRLDSAVTNNYSIIWDCCCDHGMLGMTLLKRKAASKIIFNDILEQQMELLEQKLIRFFPKPNYDWKVICQDLSLVTIPKQQSQLFIIAGVGGDKTIEFIESLTRQSLDNNFDLLICSVHGNYQVRQLLINLGYKLVSEEIVKENKRFYEIIYVSHAAKKDITLTGDEQWNNENPDHHEYLRKTIFYYSKKVKTNSEAYLPILEGYESKGFF